VCTLIDSKEKNGMYNVEYTLAKTGEFDRHLLQVVAIGTSGYYNRLYTVTAQVRDSPSRRPFSALRMHIEIGIRPIGSVRRWGSSPHPRS
jgi:hypothetical protein